MQRTRRLVAWLSTPLIAVSSLMGGVAASQGSQGKTSDGYESSEGRESQEKQGAKQRKPAGIPELRKDQLPKQTRVKPDPEKSQYSRSTVYVHVTEEAQYEEGDPFEPPVPVVRNYLAEYFRRAGFVVVDVPDQAEHRIEGGIVATFEKVIRFRDRIIGRKFLGDIDIRVLDRNGELLDRVELQGVERVNVKSEKSAVWDLRRFLAHHTYTKLFHGGRVFTNRRIVDLFQSLQVDPFEAEEEVSANQVIQELADIGFAAVPYALDALGTAATVMVDAEYPGLEDPKALKVYHVADKVLEEIFQKVSRMNLKTPDHHRFLIMRGWENEWRRFCKPFRESPEARRRATPVYRPSAGTVDEKDLEKAAEAKGPGSR